MNVLSYGIIFGILIMSIFYTFIRFIYSKELTYISYCAMQVFSLFYIATYSHIFSIPQSLQDLFLILAMISAILFAITFYEGKFNPKISNFKELLINTLLLNIVILMVFYNYLLFDYPPYTIVYGILFISIVFNLNHGLNPTTLYVIGWSLLSFLLFIFNMKEYFIEQKYIDIVLVAFAIEAVLFTTSVSYKYVLLKNKTMDYQNMLLQQSKMAQSGEMIENITHQFRQPLNNLSLILLNVKKRYEKGRVDRDYFDKKFDSAKNQIEFLSKTINDFKTFYVPSKHKENFYLKEAIENSFTIISADLNYKGIELQFHFNAPKDTDIYGIKNELSQVILALISNASDALEGIEKPWIKVEVSLFNEKVMIKIEDNAQGISKNHIKKIFDPYFTTKEEGSGIGLYLVKMIIEESFNGHIEVTNTKEGVCFTLFLEQLI